DRIGLDTNVLIYGFEGNPRYVKLTEDFFKWLDNPNHRAVISTLSMTELLVKPYNSPDNRRADGLYSIASIYPNLEWIAPTLKIADVAARLRAHQRLGLVDAIQAATAIIGQATCLVGNDAAFKRIPGLRVILLDDYIS